MPLNLPQSYDEEFCQIFKALQEKYPEEIFKLEGLHKDILDINKSAREFFKRREDDTATSDKSIDGNSNVSGNSAVTFLYEVPKPILKLNSIYNLWKIIKDDYGLDIANSILENEISGDVYINDAWDMGRPYSYHPGTSIIIKDGENIYFLTLESLFQKYFGMRKILSDYEEIDLTPFSLKVFEQNKWVDLTRVVRHNTDKKIFRFETKKGNIFTVTADHPCILSDNSEKLAENVEIGDSILSQPLGSYKENSQIRTIEFEPYKAYIIGAIIGDGHIDRKEITLYQNDIENSKIYEIFKNVYPSAYIRDGRRASYNSVEDCLWYSINIGTHARNKRLPESCLQWDSESQQALLAGLIDSDGTINKRTGVISIRTISLGIIQQVAEIATTLGFNRVRTSAPKLSNKGVIRSNSPLYCVSFSITDSNLAIVKYSEKIQKYGDIIFKDREKDGRFETDEVLYKREEDFNGKYVYDITTSSGRFYSNGHIVHNCFNYSTHDVALKGLPISSRLNIVPPKSFTSFLHQIEQFIVSAANMTLGATGLADVLIVSSWYIDRMLETGRDNHIVVARDDHREEDVWTYVKESFTSLIYTVNYGFRGNQSAFTNVSVYDKYFLMQLVPNYEINGKTPNIETVKKTQSIFIDTMNEELRRSPITFPVTTACFSIKEDSGVRRIQDDDFLDLISEKNLEHAFMNIYSGHTSTLSSCCRLRSSISDLGYTNTFGSGSSKIGSLGVVTINLPRLAKRCLDDNCSFEEFLERVKKITRVTGIINNSKRKFLKDRESRGALPLYTLGFMDFNKQYSTAGFTGLYEAMKILGYDMENEDGVNHAGMTLDAIGEENDKMSKDFGSPQNLEQVPAESSSIKLAKKDKLIGIFDDKPEWQVPFYSNQFMPLIKEGIDLIDRIEIQGKLDQKCTGGAVCHLNIDNQIQNVDTMKNLIKYACEKGVIYFAVNYQLNECKNRHFSVGRHIEKCPKCNEDIVDQYTRVVGFLTSRSHWSKERRDFDFPNRKFYSRASKELGKVVNE